WVAHLANALTGAAVAVVVFFLGREALDARRARFAGALTALHPGLVLYGVLVMGEILSALTVMTAFLVTIRGSRAWGPMRGIVGGALFLGVGALVRPQALLCAPFLVLVIHSRPEESRVRVLVARLKAAAIASVVALVPILP